MRDGQKSITTNLVKFVQFRIIHFSWNCGIY